MTVSIEQAKLKLAELVTRSRQGEEVVLTENGQSVARLVPEGATHGVLGIGWARGMLRYDPDDDTHLQDFAEHM